MSARRRYPAGLTALLILAGCDAFGPGEPTFAGPGRFVLTSIAGASLPTNVYQGGQGFTRLIADTLWLAGDGSARRAQVTFTAITWITLARTDTSTSVDRRTGIWQATGAAVEVTARASYGGDTLRLAARRDGGLELRVGAGADGAWVWERR